MLKLLAVCLFASVIANWNKNQVQANEELSAKESRLLKLLEGELEEIKRGFDRCVSDTCDDDCRAECCLDSCNDITCFRACFYDDGYAMPVEDIRVSNKAARKIRWFEKRG
ncbi:uncharacterized protein LOC132729450 isoform X2 [Ruditapes philippinarum]|uniref:uncharacterized protein LOC132729450 isoform X2 n=1 Tax=Ruditapes philippinarum TaxID=129788 RepID=UPI00295B92BF|nr:uncharacterized protein LOC132729450 isoform X2 [Ruditapes philippinarum]